MQQRLQTMANRVLYVNELYSAQTAQLARFEDRIFELEHHRGMPELLPTPAAERANAWDNLR